MQPVDVVIAVLCVSTLVAIVLYRVRKNRRAKAMGLCPGCEDCGGGCAGCQSKQRMN